MKQRRVLLKLLLAPGLDVSPSHDLGEEKQCGVKFRVQGNNSMAGTRLPPIFRYEVQRDNHYTTVLCPRRPKRPEANLACTYHS